MYVLDSDTSICIIRYHPQNVLTRISALQPGDVKLSVITLAELEYGVAKSKHIETNREALRHFASQFEILPFTDKDAEIFGIIRAALERTGTPIGPYDLQIAAQTLSRDYTLVTNNTREFMRVRNLKLENWLA
jgi:tRNA(fMet)-specific endonuclease VapC